MVSPRPSWLACASTISGVPPSWAMPTSNETRVRVLALSNSTATAFGPARGLCPYGSAFSATASSSTSACSAGLRSSSRRRCLDTCRVQYPGQRDEELLGLLLGEHQRRGEPHPVGHGVVDEEPGGPSLGGHGGRHRAGQQDADQQARAVDATDQRVPQPLD